MEVLAGYGGEFGWEVSNYYPHFVWFSENNYKVKLYTYESSLFMYKDLPGITAVSHGRDKRASGLGRPDQVNIPEEQGDRQLFVPGTAARKQFEGITKQPREIRKDCKPVDMDKHVMVHMRLFKRGKSGRNWRDTYDSVFQLFSDLGYDVYFIGDPKFSLANPEVGIDIRGYGMEEQLGIWKSADFCFGPGSGAMILSQWLGVPIFMWSDSSLRTFSSRSGWTKVWNPFRVPSYHPWSSNPTAENMARYKSQQCTPTYTEFKEGVEFMLADMDWDRQRDFKG